MKHKLIILTLLIITLGVYSCCKDYKYKTEITSLEYSSTVDTFKASLHKPLLIKFNLKHNYTQISNGSFISESKADGGTSCHDSYIGENYTDPITEIKVTCNKDLYDQNTGNDLSNTIQGMLLYYNDSHAILCSRIVPQLNNLDSYYLKDKGVDIWLRIPYSEFISTENHKFTLQFKTETGQIFTATSSELYCIKE